MNKFLLVFLALFVSNSLIAQSIEGDWNGLLEVQGMKLRLVFHITQTEKGYHSTMDSPDQNAKGIPVSSTLFEGNGLTLKVDAADITYNAILENDLTFKGTFKQAGNSFPLDLSRKAIEKPTLNRPQEPKAPLPYFVEEITFHNKNSDINLAGTLTLPHKEGSFPVAILISGSGPQNRDEEFMTHKPFLVLADHLTRNGIAVLRYDDRGFGKSTGNHNLATSLDFAEDVQAAISYLKTRKEIDKRRIGLIGHSEGGLIAPIVASQSKEVSFMVLLAGPGVSGKEISLQQIEIMGEMSGMSEEAIAGEKSITKNVIELVEKHHGSEILATKLKSFLLEQLINVDEKNLGMDKEKFIQMNVAQASRPWYAYFVQHQPSQYLEKVKCPVLAINGGKDVQVVSRNLKDIEKALIKGKNKSFKVKEFPNMNHLFQECQTGAMSEYATIEHTFSPIALDEISEWLKQLW